MQDECVCASCTGEPELPFDQCSPASCGNGKCRATGVCVNSLPAIDAPPLAPVSVVRRHVVGLAGRAGSGKSSAANYMIESLGYQRGKFAGALKEMLRTLLRYRRVDSATIERMIEGDLKEVPSPHLAGRTPRHAMQSLGTEWGRDCIHTNYWIDTEMVAKADVPALVFDDLRYSNEAEAIIAAGGTVLLIERPGAGQAAAGHSSEEGFADLPVTMKLVNNRSLAAFLADVGYVLEPAHNRD